MKFKVEKKLLGKVLAGFFACMLLFTVISRAADSVLVPRVVVMVPEKKKLTWRIQGTGSISLEEKHTMLLPEGYLAAECAKKNTQLQAGDMVVRFLMQDLEKKKLESEEEYEKLKLQMEQAKMGTQPEARVPAADTAARELESAKEGCLEAENTYNQKNEDYSQKKAEIEQEYESQKQQLDNGNTPQEGQSATDVQGKLERLQNECDIKLANLEEELNSAREIVSQKKEIMDAAQAAYDAGKAQDEVSEKNEEKNRKTADFSVRELEIDVEKQERRMGEINQLIEKNGIVSADVDGTLLDAGVQEGDITTGSELVQIGTGGVSFCAELDSKYQKQLAVGDEIQIFMSGGKEKCTITIGQIEKVKAAEKDGEKLEGDRSLEEEILQITAPISQSGYVPGAFVGFQIERNSESYDQVLPLTAVRRDNQGNYCLAAEKRSGILGEER